MDARIGALDVLPAMEADTELTTPVETLINMVKTGQFTSLESALTQGGYVDTVDNEGRSLLSHAIESKQLQIVDLLLSLDVDVEMADGLGNTPLMTAVKTQQTEMVNWLVTKGDAKVSRANKVGDTALHMAMLSRNKDIVACLLQSEDNVKHIYKRNAKGETPFSIDKMYQEQLIEDILNFKNYNFPCQQEVVPSRTDYIKTCCELLANPKTKCPLVVVAYVKKSHRISRILDNFSTQLLDLSCASKDDNLFTKSAAWCFVPLLFALGIGYIVALIGGWYAGLAMCLSTLLIISMIIVLLYTGVRIRSWSWAISCTNYIAYYVKKSSFILKLLFCNYYEAVWNIDFDKTAVAFRISSAAVSDGALGLLKAIHYLYYNLETEYGKTFTRCFPTFGYRQPASGKFKVIMCMPTFFALLALIFTALSVIGAVRHYQFNEDESFFARPARLYMFIILLVVIVCGFIFVLVTLFQSAIGIWCHYIKRLSSVIETGAMSMTTSVERKMKQCIHQLIETTRARENFGGNVQTRYVILLNATGTTQDDQVKTLVDSIRSLFLGEDWPFIFILCVNHTSPNTVTYMDSADFRDIIDIPLYLRNQVVPCLTWGAGIGGTLNRDRRYLSTYSLRSRTDTVKEGWDIGKVIAGLTPNVSSSPLSKCQLKLIYVTIVIGGVLVKYKVKFNWYKLLLWVQLTSLWPYRSAWIAGNVIDSWNSETEEKSLSDIYTSIQGFMPNRVEDDPLLYLDEPYNEFMFFMHNEAGLWLSFQLLKNFVACSINCDPAIRKIAGNALKDANSRSSAYHSMNKHNEYLAYESDEASLASVPRTPGNIWTNAEDNSWTEKREDYANNVNTAPPTNAVQHSLPPEIPVVDLSTYSIEMVAELLNSITSIPDDRKEQYRTKLFSLNITGMVLCVCDMGQLRSELQMTFGDWVLFQNVVNNIKAPQTLQSPPALSRSTTLPSQIIDSGLPSPNNRVPYNNTFDDRGRSGLPVKATEMPAPVWSRGNVASAKSWNLTYSEESDNSAQRLTSAQHPSLSDADRPGQTDNTTSKQKKLRKQRGRQFKASRWSSSPNSKPISTDSKPVVADAAPRERSIDGKTLHTASTSRKERDEPHDHQSNECTCHYWYEKERHSVRHAPNGEVHSTWC